MCNCNTKGFINNVDVCYPTLRESENECADNAYGGKGCCDTYPDSTNNHLSLACEAMIQGSNRLQRGLLYMQYLRLYWAKENFSPRYSVISGMMHNLTAFLRSDEFQNYVFQEIEA